MSGSSIVLQWLHGSDKTQQTFVANHVGQKLDLSLASQSKHCPRCLNQADNGPGKTPFAEFTPNCCWLHGLEFFLHQICNGPRHFSFHSRKLHLLFSIILSLRRITLTSVHTDSLSSLNQISLVLKVFVLHTKGYRNGSDCFEQLLLYSEQWKDSN